MTIRPGDTKPTVKGGAFLWPAALATTGHNHLAPPAPGGGTDGQSGTADTRGMEMDGSANSTGTALTKAFVVSLATQIKGTSGVLICSRLVRRHRSN